MDKELIKLRKISEMTSLSVRVLRKMIKKGTIKAVIINGNYYVRPNDYIDFMFNLECQRLGISYDEAKKLIKQEQHRKFNELINSEN